MENTSKCVSRSKKFDNNFMPVSHNQKTKNILSLNHTINK